MTYSDSSGKLRVVSAISSLFFFSSFSDADSAWPEALSRFDRDCLDLNLFYRILLFLDE